MTSAEGTIGQSMKYNKFDSWDGKTSTTSITKMMVKKHLTTKSGCVIYCCITFHVKGLIAAKQTEIMKAFFKLFSLFLFS